MLDSIVLAPKQADNPVLVGLFRCDPFGAREDKHSSIIERGWRPREPCDLFKRPQTRWSLNSKAISCQNFCLWVRLSQPIHISKILEPELGDYFRTSAVMLMGRPREHPMESRSPNAPRRGIQWHRKCHRFQQ
jgi:hypothetical protein